MRNASQISVVSTLIEECDVVFKHEISALCALHGQPNGPLTKEKMTILLVASAEEAKKLRTFPSLRQKFYPDDEPKKEELSKKDAKKLAKEQKKFEKAKKKFDEQEKKKQEKEKKRKSASFFAVLVSARKIDQILVRES